MALLLAFLPDCEWGGGSANINVRAYGPLAAPLVEGSAAMSKATLRSNVLRYPLTHLGADLQVRGLAYVRPRTGPWTVFCG